MFGTGTASAHIKLKTPAPRLANNPLKEAPCGPATTTRGTSVTMFTSGQTITVTWDETIQHPGHYRIAFDNDGNDFPDPMSFEDIAAEKKDLGSGVTVLLDGIMDTSSRAYTADVTLPDIECDNCTLQLIQVMTDKGPYGNGDDIYHECANIVLKKAGGGTAGSGAGGAGAGGSAAGAGGAAAAGSGAAVAGSGAGAAGSGAAAAGSGAAAAGSGAAGAGAGGAPVSAGAGTTGSAAGSGVARAAVGMAGSLASAGSSAAGAVAPAPAGSTDDSGCAVVAAGAGHRRSGVGAAALAVSAVAMFTWRRRRKR